VCCEGRVPPLNEKEAKEYLTQISDNWKVIGNSNITKGVSICAIHRHTIDFVNKVADIAEGKVITSDLHVFYGREVK